MCVCVYVKERVYWDRVYWDINRYRCSIWKKGNLSSSPKFLEPWLVIWDDGMNRKGTTPPPIRILGIMGMDGWMDGYDVE